MNCKGGLWGRNTKNQGPGFNFWRGGGDGRVIFLTETGPLGVKSCRGATWGADPNSRAGGGGEKQTGAGASISFGTKRGGGAFGGPVGKRQGFSGQGYNAGEKKNPGRPTCLGGSFRGRKGGEPPGIGNRGASRGGLGRGVRFAGSIVAKNPKEGFFWKKRGAGLPGNYFSGLGEKKTREGLDGQGGGGKGGGGGGEGGPAPKPRRAVWGGAVFRFF